VIYYLNILICILQIDIGFNWA